MVGLAFAIAASCNFPVLVMSIFWKGLTTRGALIGGFLGLTSAVVGVILSPAVWEATLGNPKGRRRLRWTTRPYSRSPSHSPASGCFRFWTAARAPRFTRAASTHDICAQPDRDRRGYRHHALTIRKVGRVCCLPSWSGSASAHAFDASNPPFDRLTSLEVEKLRAALDVAYFRPGETIIAQHTPANALFVVIKGTIEERDGSDLVALLAPRTVRQPRSWCTARAATPSWLARRRCATSLPRA